MSHTFTKSQAFEQANSGDLDSTYRLLWPGCKIEYVRDAKRQKAGIDKVIHTKWKDVTLDEKIRSRDYGDCLLEIVSNDQRQTPGWAVDDGKVNDLVVVAYRDSRTAYFVPREGLVRATKANADKWREEHRPVYADNGHYTTISIAVPWSVLGKSMGRELRPRKMVDK